MVNLLLYFLASTLLVTSIAMIIECLIGIRGSNNQGWNDYTTAIALMVVIFSASTRYFTVGSLVVGLLANVAVFGLLMSMKMVPKNEE